MVRVGWLIIGVLALAVGVLGGCSRSLFPDDVTRTPYERYLSLRGQDRPVMEQTPFGGERPNLRQRLAPLGQP